MRGPVVGEFVAGFLPGHALLNPLLAAAMFLPGGAGAFEGAGGVGHLLHPLVTDFGQPEFDRLGLGAGNALDEAKQGLGIGNIGEVAFAVGSGQFQLVTIRHLLTAFLVEPLCWISARRTWTPERNQLWTIWSAGIRDWPPVADDFAICFRGGRFGGRIFLPMQQTRTRGPSSSVSVFGRFASSTRRV